MLLSELEQKAAEVQDLYTESDQQKYGSAWTPEETTLGFVGDVGAVAKLVLSAEGKLHLPDTKAKLEHELTECMRSIMNIASAYDIDLEQALVNSLDQAKQRLKK